MNINCACGVPNYPNTVHTPTLCSIRHNRLWLARLRFFFRQHCGHYRRVKRFWAWLRRDLIGPLVDDEDYETGMPRPREWSEEMRGLIKRVTEEE